MADAAGHDARFDDIEPGKPPSVHLRGNRLLAILPAPAYSAEQARLTVEIFYLAAAAAAALASRDKQSPEASPGAPPVNDEPLMPAEPQYQASQTVWVRAKCLGTGADGNPLVLVEDGTLTGRRLSVPGKYLRPDLPAVSATPFVPSPAPIRVDVIGDQIQLGTGLAVLTRDEAEHLARVLDHAVDLARHNHLVSEPRP